MNHDSYSPDYIRAILQSVKTIALVGASASAVRPSNLVLKYLLDKGYNVIPVNPLIKGQILHGQKVHAALADITVAIDMVDVFRNPEAALAVVQDALALSPLPKVIWMQLGIRNDAAAQLAESKGLQVVMNRCVKMEYGKHSGEWAWVGGDPGFISSRRQTLHHSGRLQSLGLAEGKE